MQARLLVRRTGAKSFNREKAQGQVDSEIDTGDRKRQK